MQNTQTNDGYERSVLTQKLVQLGPYRLREIIGEGGMGAVYLADQFKPVQRRVAIKVTRIDLASISRVARFESERQILATLKHPNIAQVFDAGATPEGYPFMVMEYIDGVAIDQYAKREQLAVTARIALILQACEAVAHAHQNGVIHRDLKPENLLVEKLDQSARVKLIDFGIAKLVEGATSQLTATGIALGTPRYMSPEQTRANPHIDTRTDVYSLGLTLFRLLTGALPNDANAQEPQEKWRDPFAHAALAPSRVVSKANAQIATAIGMPISRAELCTTLRGELDWIVLKAIAPNREQRYGSVREFAQDLQRFLAQEPVLAAPPNRWYPWAKFFRRYRWQTAAVLLSSFLLASAVLSLLQAWQQERAARAIADQRLKQHEFFNAFVIELLSTVKASKPGSEVTLNDILHHAVQQMPEQLRKDPRNGRALGLLLGELMLGSKTQAKPTNRIHTAPSENPNAALDPQH
jgi:eukaryotic-like serine/threonine-protein kinase